MRLFNLGALAPNLAHRVGQHFGGAQDAAHLFHHNEFDLARRVGPDITAFLADLNRVGVDVVAVGLVFLASPAGRKCARLLRKKQSAQERRCAATPGATALTFYLPFIIA